MLGVWRTSLVSVSLVPGNQEMMGKQTCLQVLRIHSAALAVLEMLLHNPLLRAALLDSLQVGLFARIQIYMYICIIMIITVVIFVIIIITVFENFMYMQLFIDVSA